MSRSGYTLPVFACAAAVAALHWLRDRQPLTLASIDLIEPAQIAEIPIEQVAGLSENTALAITRSDPGDNLDLTKNTPIWALVEWGQQSQTEQIVLKGGEGIGRQLNAGGQAAMAVNLNAAWCGNCIRWLPLRHGQKFPCPCATCGPSSPPSPLPPWPAPASTSTPATWWWP